MKDIARVILVVLWWAAATAGHAGTIGDSLRQECDFCGAGFGPRAGPGGAAFQWEKAIVDSASSWTPRGPDLQNTMDLETRVVGLPGGLLLESDVLIPVTAHPTSSDLHDLQHADLACVDCADPAVAVDSAAPVPLGRQFSLLALMATTLLVFGVFIVRVVRALQRMRQEALSPYLERHRRV